MPGSTSAACSSESRSGWRTSCCPRAGTSGRSSSAPRLIGSLLLTLAFGWLVAAPSAVTQTKRITTESPVGHLAFTCGVWIADPTAPVKRTLVIDGLTCRRLTVYEGYRQLRTETLTGSVSPLAVRTPEGMSIDSGLVSAPYEAILAIAISSRLDGHADRILGLHLLDGSKAWEYGCASLGELTVRFAGVPGGDHPGLGQITLPNEVPSVVVGCPAKFRYLDPATGVGARREALRLSGWKRSSTSIDG